MHTYATNCPWHPKLIMGLTFLAIAVSAGISWIAASVEGLLGWSIGGVSAAAVFGGLYFLFDKYLWRIRRVREALLVPNLNGKWLCVGRTLVKNGQDVSFDWRADIFITQSWSHVSVVLKTSQSTSHSLAASLYRVQGEGYRLIYHYDNSPAVTEPHLNRHCGLCDLMFTDDINSASGKYFTDRDRLTVGTMTLTKEGNTNEQI